LPFGHRDSGTNDINMVFTLLFPWHENDAILDFIKVSFVGPRGIADRCLKALCSDYSLLLRMDIKPLAFCLGLLQACPSGYSHLQLPSQAQKDETQVKLR
jgi:hypothetical protein